MRSVRDTSLVSTPLNAHRQSQIRDSKTAPWYLQCQIIVLRSSPPRSFLARLLDALRARVERSLALCDLPGELIASLFVCFAYCQPDVVENRAAAAGGVGKGRVRTGSHLGVVGEVVLVEILRLLLRLLVVNGVGTGCFRVMSAWFVLRVVLCPRFTS
jgi:hypothetical protein